MSKKKIVKLESEIKNNDITFKHKLDKLNDQIKIKDETIAKMTDSYNKSERMGYIKSAKIEKFVKYLSNLNIEEVKLKDIASVKKNLLSITSSMKEESEKYQNDFTKSRDKLNLLSFDNGVKDNQALIIFKESYESIMNINYINETIKLLDTKKKEYSNLVGTSLDA